MTHQELKIGGATVETSMTDGGECLAYCVGKKRADGEYVAPEHCDRPSGPAVFPAVRSPELLGLMRYWLSLREDSGVPERHRFDPVKVPALLSQFWIIQREDGTDRYRFLLAGEKIRSLLGRRVADIYVDELFAGHKTEMHEAIETVLDTPAVHYAVGPLYRAGMHALQTERLALPMAEDGRVNTVYGATLYRKPVAVSNEPTEYINDAQPVIVRSVDLPCRGCLMV